MQDVSSTVSDGEKETQDVSSSIRNQIYPLSVLS